MTKPLNAHNRKEAIKQLIKKHPIENQEMLVNLLKKEFNIEVNQSIVSRDLRDLGVVKHRFKDRMIYECSEVDVTKEILRLSVLDVVHNEAMIVIRTIDGLAAFVGDYLDQYVENGILATLAGENVVFVTPHSIKQIDRIFDHVCELVHFKQIRNKK